MTVNQGRAIVFMLFALLLFLTAVVEVIYPDMFYAIPLPVRLLIIANVVVGLAMGVHVTGEKK